MKCRYDMTRRCTVDCEKIRTCAWMADETRRNQKKEAGSRIRAESRCAGRGGRT